jgi:hypothetical protein
VCAQTLRFALRASYSTVDAEMRIEAANVAHDAIQES